MPHRRSHHHSGNNPQNNLPDNLPGSSQAHNQKISAESVRLRSSTHTLGANARPTESSAAPRWEHRHRAPSQREPLQREVSRRELSPNEPSARHQSPREFRWTAPRSDEWVTSPIASPEPEAPQQAVLPQEVSTQPPQWSQSDLEDLARETMAGRGRRLSRRRARALAAKARQRHIKVRKTEAQPKRKRPPVWRLFRAIAFTLCLVALFEFGAAALTSPRFAVQEVSSDPVQVVPQAAIEQVETSLVGQNFFRADTASGVENLAQLPPVQAVSIHRQLDWPPRLHLSITERQPFARVDNGQGENQWVVVDEEGVPFRPATSQDAALYAVSSKALRPIIGQKLKAEQWAPVVEFAQTLQQDTEQGHNWALRAIYFDEHGFASLRLAESGTSPDRLLVHLGTAPWEKKLQRTRQALAWFESKGVQAESLNLISSKKLVWTPRLPKLEENPSAPSSSPSDQPT